MRPLMTVEQVAELLNVTPARLYSWRHKRLGPPAIKLEGVLRWRPEDVEEWLQTQEQESNHAAS